VGKKGLSSPFAGAEGAGDFFAPFFTLKFLTVEQLEGNVNVDGEQVGGNESQPIPESTGATKSGTITGVFDYSNTMRSFSPSIEITMEGGAFSQASVTIEPPFADAVMIVDDRVIQRNGVMVIEWGWLPSNSYGKRLTSDTHIFSIMKPGLEMSSTDIRITIRGVDLFANSGIERQPTESYARSKNAASKATVDGTFPTDLSILRHIASKTKQTVDEAMVSADSPLRAQRPLNKSEPELLEQNECDWLLFRRICDENRCSFYVLGDKVIVGDMNKIKGEEASYTLVFMQQPVSDRHLPMTAFSTRAEETMFSTPAGRGIIHLHADPDTGETSSEKHDPLLMADEVHTGSLNQAGAANADGLTYQVDESTQVVSQPAFGPNDTGKVVGSPHGAPNRDENAKRLVRDANTWMNTKATATVLGHPHLVPMMIVNVECGSSIFSGAYRIIKAVHRIGMDGYETDLELVRESASGDKNVGRGKVPLTGGKSPPTRSGSGEGVEPDTEAAV